MRWKRSRLKYEDINVTLDTDVLDSTTVAKMKQAAQELPIVFGNVTVSEREKERSGASKKEKLWVTRKSLQRK